MSTRVTHGDFVVSDVTDSIDGRYLYYTANVDHPGIYETYRYDIRDEAIEQLTDLGGNNASLVSPDGEHLRGDALDDDDAARALPPRRRDRRARRPR